MARRSDHSREELTRLAIDAGHNIIKNEGFAALSARKVASVIGYTVGTIYHVFGSHDEFLLHISAKTLDEWYAALEKANAAQGGPLGIRQLARFYIDYSAAHYNEWSGLFEHKMSPGALIPDWYMPKMRRFFDLVETMVMPHVKNNHEHARRAARVLWAGIHGICILAHTRKLDLVEAESAYVLAESFVDNYLRGLEKA